MLTALSALSLWAQDIVQVGKGSYAAYAPLAKSRTADHSGDQSQYMQYRKLYIREAAERPIPTNDWWTDLINADRERSAREVTGHLWSYPQYVQGMKYGIDVHYPKYWVDNGTEMKAQSKLMVKCGDTFSASHPMAESWSDDARKLGRSGFIREQAPAFAALPVRLLARCRTGGILFFVVHHHMIQAGKRNAVRLCVFPCFAPRVAVEDDSVGSVIEGIFADACHTVRDHDILQAGAFPECPFTDTGHAALDRDTFQAGASVERLVIDFFHAARNRDLFQAFTQEEESKVRHGARDRDVLQVVACVKRVSPDGRYAARNRIGRIGRACGISDQLRFGRVEQYAVHGSIRGISRRDIDSFQAAAAYKRVVRKACHAGRDREALQVIAAPE